jgi:hypothetical protein
MFSLWMTLVVSYQRLSLVQVDHQPLSLDTVPADSEMVIVVSSTPSVPSMFRTMRRVCCFDCGRIGL